MPMGQLRENGASTGGRGCLWLGGSGACKAGLRRGRVQVGRHLLRERDTRTGCGSQGVGWTRDSPGRLETASMKCDKAQIWEGSRVISKRS